MTSISLRRCRIKHRWHLNSNIQCTELSFGGLDNRGALQGIYQNQTSSKVEAELWILEELEKY